MQLEEVEAGGLLDVEGKWVLQWAHEEDEVLELLPSKEKIESNTYNNSHNNK